MPELNPTNSFDTLGLALWARTGTDLPGHVRPLEYFGGRATGFSETPVDNLAALTAALSWCAGTGGMVVLGAGVYGVDGPVPLKSYANLAGMGKFHTHLRQLAATPTDVLTSGDAPGESLAFCQIRDLTIDGGWSPGWSNDRATHTAAGIRLIGRFEGPDDPTALIREGVEVLTDPFHVVSDVRITNVAGSGIVTGGRGEIQILNNYIVLCSLYGMDLGAPDCWFANNSVNRTGDSAVRTTSGNQRFSNEKYWFTGMRTDMEGIGAGLEISGPIIQNLVASNLTTQDTWGPGVVLDGDGPVIYGNIDEPAGGRVEEQLFGWREGRTLPRSCVLFNGPCKGARLAISVAGGGRLGPENRPKLVHFNSSGARNNVLDFAGERLALDAAPISEEVGYTNARRVNTVTLDGALLHGALNSGDIADATHPINTESKLKSVHLTDGSLAIRKESGWAVLSGSEVVVS